MHELYCKCLPRWYHLPENLSIGKDTSELQLHIGNAAGVDRWLGHRRQSRSSWKQEKDRAWDKFICTIFPNILSLKNPCDQKEYKNWQRTLHFCFDSQSQHQDWNRSVRSALAGKMSIYASSVARLHFDGNTAPVNVIMVTNVSSLSLLT